MKIPGSDRPPTPELAVHRLRVMRGAAFYAELAAQTGTWSARGIELALDGKGVLTKGAPSRGESVNKYSRYLKGTVPKGTFRTACEKYPDSEFEYWARHPIGQLLTRADLAAGEVVAMLEQIPGGVARQLIWDENAGSRPHGSRREVPDRPENIQALAELRTTDALLALLARRRLRRMMGQTEHEDVYEFAIMDCFADVVGSQPHLCLAQHVIVPTFADYLEWPPDAMGNAGERSISPAQIEYWASVTIDIDRARNASQVRGVKMPPSDYIDKVAPSPWKQR